MGPFCIINIFMACKTEQQSQLQRINRITAWLIVIIRMFDDEVFCQEILI
jgi:hypothetical protein